HDRDRHDRDRHDRDRHDRDARDQDTGEEARGEQVPPVVIPTVGATEGESPGEDASEDDEPSNETPPADAEGDKQQAPGAPGGEVPGDVQPGVTPVGGDVPATQAPGDDSPEAASSGDEGTDVAKVADDVPTGAPSGGSEPTGAPASGAKPTGAPTIGSAPSPATGIPSLGSPPDSGADTSPALSPAAADVDSAGSTRSPDIVVGAIDDLPDLGDRLGTGMQTPLPGTASGTMDALTPGTEAGLDISDLIALVESGEIDGLLISSSDGKIILEVNPSASEGGTPGVMPPTPGAGDRVNEMIGDLDTQAFRVTEQGSGAGAIDFPGQLVVISVAASAGYLVARLGKR
ncbi:MAG: hypothetical protein ACC667_11645, partial [Longimicrobiales bacterium]